MLTVKGSIIKLVGPFFMSIYIRMPTINFSVTQSIETLAVNLSASEALVMNINNPLIGASYFGLETIPDSIGVYTSTAPKNTSGSFTLGTGVIGVVRDDYKMSAVVSPGNNVLTFSPAVAVTGSTLRTRGIGAPPLSTGFDADAQAFFDRVTAAGGTLSATEQTAVNTLVVTMKADGTWTPMKAIYPMVGASAAACAQNLKSSSFTGTFTSGWTFASTGVTPNGSSAYLDTNLIPGTTLSSSSASLGFVTNVANTNTSGIEMGVQSAVDGMSLWTQFSSSNVSRIGRGNDATTGLPYTLAGRFYGSRTSSTLQTLYRNGSSVATGSGAVSGLDSVYKITLGALNLSGTPGLFANGTYTFVFIGDGLSGTNITNLDTSIVTFNTTLSR